MAVGPTSLHLPGLALTMYYVGPVAQVFLGGWTVRLSLTNWNPILDWWWRKPEHRDNWEQRRRYY